jgi:hypothetical protein
MAPLNLADRLREWGRLNEADAMYRDIANRGAEWDRTHKDNPIGESYGVAAYRGRLQAAVDGRQSDGSINSLIQEIRDRVPSAAGELESELAQMRQGAAPARGANQSVDGAAAEDSPQP